MSVKPFSEREFELLKLAFQCVENPKGLKIDIEKFQGLGGFSTAHSARSSWCNLKVKLGLSSSKPTAANTEDSTSNPANAEAETPKPKKRKRANSPSGDSPASAKKKRAIKPAPAKELKPEMIKVEQEASPQASPEGSVSPS